MDENNIPEMKPQLELIKKIGENGNEYWTSRDLCGALGYATYYKFISVINKAVKIAQEKGMDINNHFYHAVEMVRLGSGAYRKVENYHLSRMACLIIAENADSKKELVRQARAYFKRGTSIFELTSNSLSSSILLYRTGQSEVRIEVIFNSETFWMSQKRMAILFGVDVKTINYHLGQIYESGELEERGTIRKIQIVQQEGARNVERNPLFYNLDAIIAVGYI